MRYKITGRNINVTPGLKAAVEEKIGKLERYFNQDTEVNIYSDSGNESESYKL